MFEDYWAWSEKDKKALKFYNQFMSCDDIVFDIGANLSNRSKVFCGLNTLVFAFEPNPCLVAFIRSVFSTKPNFYIFPWAVGSKEGNTLLYVCNAHTLSSCSLDWINTVKVTRFKDFVWDKGLNVRLVTLDNIINKIGIPKFIKVDVEGAELEVINGLSSAVDSLSLEVIPEFAESIYICVDRLSSLAEYSFQLEINENFEFILTRWVNALELKNEIKKLSLDVYANVYAKLRK